MDAFVIQFFVGLIFGLQLPKLSECYKLNDCIDDFDTLNYNPKPVRNKHSKYIRNPNHVQHLDIKAFGRVLELELKKDRGVFTNDHESDLGNGTVIDDDLSFLYSGYVKGFPDSHCHGAVIQGIFLGVIYLPTETFYVETSSRFFDQDPGFHSVIYRESDVRCNDVPKRGFMQHMTNLRQTLTNNAKTIDTKEIPNRRQKRAVEGLGENNTCTLYLRSDPMFWKHHLNKSEGDRDMARRQILAIFASHVQFVNNILANTTFQTYNGSNGYFGLRLAIAKTTIMTDEDCPASSNSTYCYPKITPDNFLALVSQDNYDSFCLAYTFTHRDFTGGILGKAWTAFPGTSGGSGGMCERYKRYANGGNPTYMSYNTGMITTINYGKELFITVSHLNFAHQIGHSLGALNDNGNTCVPYYTSCPDSEPGNYIMFDGTSSWNCENNLKFSLCSRHSIALVLHEFVVTRPDTSCLVAYSSICGNGIVEEDEECDCGYTNECRETCCTPRHPNETNPDMCRLSETWMVCSPSQGPCCNDSCQYVDGDDSVVCFEGDCMIAYCTGSSASCPTPTIVENGTPCGSSNSGYVCQNGVCTSP